MLPPRVFGTLLTLRAAACSDGDWNCSKATAINGGIPQLANMSAHLAQLRLDIESDFPDPMWDGIAVIDYGELPHELPMLSLRLWHDLFI